MASIYEQQKYLHILSNNPDDIDVYTWKDAERGVIFVAIETESYALEAIDRSRVVISLPASDYPAFAQRVCDALVAPMAGEGSKTP